jgi:hypothetical protein
VGVSVDLGELIEPLRGRVNPPGTDLFPSATDDDWLVRLTNAFWDARLNGISSFMPFTESGGAISPLEDGDDDMSRTLQQLIVVYAAWRVVLARYTDIKTQFRAKAGPVEYEKQQSATVLKAVLDALRSEIDEINDNLSEYGGSDAVVFDALIERETSMTYGDVWWIR